MGLLISLYYAILIIKQMVPNIHMLLLNVLADSYRCKKKNLLMYFKKPQFLHF